MITYDEEDCIIHWAAKGYLDMVFKPHKSGLHVYEPDDPRGLASYSFIETVESNMASFTKRQIHGTNLACNLQAGLAFPSNQDMKWEIQLNLIKDCSVTVKDVGTAIKVWGPIFSMLKGKTVRTTPKPVRQYVIEIPKEIWELNKDVTLTIDIFFQKDSILCCVGETLEQYESSNHLQIFENYLQLLPNSEFAPLEVWIATVYGVPTLNLASANKHDPKIEQKIRVIKEQVQAVIYSIPFNSFPAWMLIHAVLFVV